MQPELDKEQESKPVIDVYRPTGPRITESEALSLGEIVVHKAKELSDTGAKLIVSTVRNHKTATTITASTLLAMGIHFIVAMLMMSDTRVAYKPYVIGGSGTSFTVPSTSSSFQGIADPSGSGGGGVTGWTFWGSCARVYSNAKASTSTSMCDLVASGGDGTTVVCTLRGTTSGFVDLTAYCPGSLTPAAACAAVTSCHLKVLYDQSGSGNNMSNTTLATQPDIDFSTGLNGLPGFSCVGRGGGSCFVVTTGTAFTIGQPYNYQTVYKSATIGAATGLVGVDNSTVLFMGVSSVADVATLGNPGGASASVSAANSLWHALQGVLNDPNCLLRAESNTVSGVACGSTTYSGTQLRCHRADGGNNQDIANMMECGIIVNGSTALTDPQLLNINNNAHSSGNGYNF